MSTFKYNRNRLKYNTDSVKSAHAIWKVHMHQVFSISEIVCIFIRNSCKSYSNCLMNKHSKTYWIYVYFLIGLLQQKDINYRFKEIHAFKNIQQFKINMKNKMWQGITV
jgi:hypothetical protein